MPLDSLLTELKRRRVFRVAAVYLVVAWMCAQVADVVFPALHLPVWTITLVVVLLLVGFPVALVLAWAFDVTPAGVRRTRPVAVPGPAERTGNRRVRRSAVLVLGGVVVMAGAWLAIESPGGEAVRLSDKLVAVTPFRVGGADGSLAYLSEGMVDLLEAKLAGNVGFHPVDARTVMAVWQRSTESAEQSHERAFSVARSVGAGVVIVGGIVGTPSRMIVTASLLDTRSGTRRARAEVDGPADSLPSMVDRLTARLLSSGAGEGELRLEDLTSRSLPALQHYLAGRTSYRAGRYVQAAVEFEQAVLLDSTFALAGLGLLLASEWATVGQAQRLELANRTVLANIDRLTIPDRALFHAKTPPAWPLPRRSGDDLAAARHATHLVAKHPDAWYEFGDVYFHMGAALGIDDAAQRAAAAFRRALELDSGFVAAIEHLIDTQVLLGDADELSRLWVLYFGSDADPEIADFYRWRIAVGRGDGALLDSLRHEYDDVPPASLWRIIGYAQLDGTRVGDAIAAADALVRSGSATDAPTQSALLELALNRGDLERAAELVPTLPTTDEHLFAAHLFWDLPAPFGEAARRRLESTIPSGASATLGARGSTALCLVSVAPFWLEQDTVGLASAARRLQVAAAQAASHGDSAHIAGDCALLLETIVAVAADRADADALTARLNELSRRGFSTTAALVHWGPLVLARVLEQRGAHREALAAVRRRPYLWSNPNYLPASLFLEGRLASVVGDEDGSIRAYRHYLALREDAHPSLQPAVQSARAALARLLGDRPVR